jgi:hypothetical protein
MLVSRYQNADQNLGIKIANRSFENVSQFKCLGTTVTNQYLIQESIKRRLNSDYACYRSVENLLSARLLPKNEKMRICKTTNLPVVLYGCETWSLIFREEHKLRVKNGVFWDVTPCDSCKNRRFGGTWRLLHQGDKNR